MDIKYIIFFSTVSLSVFIDQFSKYLIVSLLSSTGSFSIFRYFSLTLVKNTGICFGVFNNLNLKNFIIVASLFIAAGIFLSLKKVGKDKPTVISLGLIEGGILGNLIDRIRIGAVIDFINFHFWPVFNLADTFIVCGVITIVIRHWKKERRCIQSF